MMMIERQSLDTLLREMERDDLKELLERVVDKFCLGPVLADLAEICWEKAEHLEANWQDPPAARWWEGMADRLEGM